MRTFTPPSEFDEYRLVRVLGQGAMGTVWLAHDQNLDRPVAIKFISQATPDAEARDRFFIEARAVARLHHPNVVTIHRVGEVAGHPYLLSEFVRGTTLDQLPRPIDGAQAFELALGLARGLAAAHRHGVLHRDIKPANAILTEEKEVKLLDFGLAKLFGDVEVAASPPPVDPQLAIDETMPRGVMATPRVLVERVVTQTEIGVVVGTPAYLAPELWLGEPATAASDVYALGASLFHMLTGRLPHEAPSAVALAARVAAEDAPPLRSFRPDCPAALAEVIDACLVRDPLARLASGEAVREALEQRARAARRPSLPEGNPYRGLHAFGAEHRNLFFGRDLEIADVLERLRSEPWVVVAGRSGAGKSSLVRAGILPRIVDDGALAEGGGPSAWRVLSLMPGARPHAALVAAAAALLSRDEAALARALEEDPGVVARELRGDRKTGTVVLIDQLEELVTLSAPDERSRFVEALRHLLTPAPALRVVATLRSDFVGHLEALGPTHRELTRALYVLGPMTPEGLRDAVIAPAAAHDVAFEAEADVDALVAAVEENQGSLPLVEFALAKLWDLRDPARKVIGRDALPRIGGVEGALARHADEVIASLSPEGAREAKRILLRLVTVERTRARRSEEDLVSAGDGPIVRETLEALVRGRLLAAGEGTFEVAHEALITSWPRLRLWLDEEQGAHQVRARLEIAAADWERLGHRPEALWQGRRLDELALVEGPGLFPRERTFIDASRRTDRRRRWSRRVLLVAAPTVLFGTILGVQAWNRRAAANRADAAVALARARLDDARAASAVVEVMRRTAFAVYDTRSPQLASELWQRVEPQIDHELALQDDVLEPLNEAFVTVAGHEAATRTAADLYAARFASAERDRNLKRRAVEERQLRFFDREKRYARFLEGVGTVDITSDPPGARVELARFVDSDEDGRLEEEPRGSLGTTPVTRRPLEMGSYVATLSRDGYSSVRYPFVVGRQEEARLGIRLLRGEQIPPGFVYVPGGTSLVGTSRYDSPLAFPLRERLIASFFVARTEVTFGDWLPYVASLPPAQRRSADIGGLLGDTADGSVQLDLSEMGLGIVRQGRPVSYTRDRQGRDAQIDWSRWPVVYVASSEMMGYIQWLGGKIPGARFCTAVEWERAARGADGRLYPHGSALRPGDASFGDTYGFMNAHRRWLDEVGLFPSSRSVFGVDDLVGSVAEVVVSASIPGFGLLKPGSWRQRGSSLSADIVLPLPPGHRTIESGLRICANSPN